jgi:hypothetical protein
MATSAGHVQTSREPLPSCKAVALAAATGHPNAMVENLSSNCRKQCGSVVSLNCTLLWGSGIEVHMHKSAPHKCMPHHRKAART